MVHLENTPIICVDDEPMMLSALARILRSHFEVVVAGGGKEALEHLQQRGPFAMILSDLLMPGMDGISLLSQAKDLAPSTVRILLTGRTSLETAVDAVNRAEIFRLLIKPVPTDNLIDTLHDAVERYRQNRLNEILDEERKKLATINEQLYQTSITDPLTGLLNRRGFETRLFEEVARTERYGGDTSSVLIDCDRLKSINTKFGHAIGDKALRYIASSISENTRTTDAVARIGGDEFLLLLPETHVSKATIVAEKIRQKISSSKVWTSLGPVHVSISAGVSAIPSNIEKIEDILILLSEALRASKEEGRDRVIASELALLPNNAVSAIDYKKQ